MSLSDEMVSNNACPYCYSNERKLRKAVKELMEEFTFVGMISSRLCKEIIEKHFGKDLI